MYVVQIPNGFYLAIVASIVTLQIATFIQIFFLAELLLFLITVVALVLRGDRPVKNGTFLFQVLDPNMERFEEDITRERIYTRLLFRVIGLFIMFQFPANWIIGYLTFIPTVLFKDD